jgi:lipopolysaccharide/colanic/teichoic acid biosynthesis glycosyltransferase
LTDWASIWNINEAALLSKYNDADHTYQTIIHPVKRELQLIYAAKRSLGYNLRILFATALRLGFGVSWFPQNVSAVISKTIPKPATLENTPDAVPRVTSRFKRFLDVFISTLALVLLVPVFVIVGTLILLESGRPVMFSQERIGLKFRTFKIHKFRTMRVREYGPLITVTGDPRVTSVGSILRAAKLDELPQFWNVLKGDMSLVGPRPEVREYVERFRSRYERILSIRPGMTDLASIRFRKEEEVLAASPEPLREYFEHILPAKLDLADEYLQTASMSQDLSILFQTAVAITKK